MPLHQIQRLAQAGQHAEAEHVDLQNVERVEIVLVPFDEGALRHGAVADRHHLVEPAARDDEAADVLRQMAREAGDRARKRADLLDALVARIEPGAREVGLAVAAAAPDRGGQRTDGVFAQAEGLADLADRRTAAVADDGRRDTGALAAVFAVDILDHLLAPLVFEIDVDVGRLAPLRRDEALEQEVGAVGIDLGDAEAEADRGIGGRAAALAEDALAAREAHDVVDGEEVGRVGKLRDQRQFVFDVGAHLGRQAVRIARGGALVSKMRQRVLRVGKTVDALIGIFVAQLIERKGERFTQARRFLDRLRRVAEQPRHFVRGFKMALGIGGELAAGAVDGGFLTDAGEYVSEHPPVGMVIEHVVDRDQRHVRLARQRNAARQPRPVAPAIGHGSGKSRAAGGRGA